MEFKSGKYYQCIVSKSPGYKVGKVYLCHTKDNLTHLIGDDGFEDPTIKLISKFRQVKVDIGLRKKDDPGS